jgi:hypothetical protein
MSTTPDAPGTMNVVVMHDSEGRILAVVAQPADAPVGSITSMTNDHAELQVELPELRHGLEPLEVARILADIRANHRVRDGRLVRSPVSAAE